jgi:hypothetical protein
MQKKTPIEERGGRNEQLEGFNVKRPERRRRRIDSTQLQAAQPIDDAHVSCGSLQFSSAASSLVYLPSFSIFV